MGPFTRVDENTLRAVERKAGVDHRHDLLGGVAVIGVIQNGIGRDVGSLHQPGPGYLPGNPLYMDKIEARSRRPAWWQPTIIGLIFLFILGLFWLWELTATSIICGIILARMDRRAHADQSMSLIATSIAQHSSKSRGGEAKRSQPRRSISCRGWPVSNSLVTSRHLRRGAVLEMPS